MNSKKSLFSTYLQRYAISEKIIEEKPDKNLKLIVVIPCKNEPDIFNTLNYLKNTQKPKFHVEIIIVINASETDNDTIKQQNTATYQTAKDWKKETNKNWLTVHFILKNNLPKKHAGVGLARKIGFDEAVWRLHQTQNHDGVLVSFDADTICQENYLQAIEQVFFQKGKATKTNLAVLNFEHEIDGTNYSPENYRAVIQYELHLRYYVEALKYTGFPYAYHTIGSAFAVRAKVYAKQGGMNRKQAGEDFYFLHKIFPLGKVVKINETTVIPASRISDRVPFGTGVVIQKLLNQNKKEFLTFNPQAFIPVKNFIDLKQQLFYASEKEAKQFVEKLHHSMSVFLQENNFMTELKKIKKNSPTIPIFEKRFFDWFNAFRIFKFLNFAKKKSFNEISVKNATFQLLNDYLKIPINKNNSTKNLLIILRKINQ